MEPDADMMAPVEAVARFMAEGADVAGAFAAQGVVIFENFPPFRFEGQDASARWRQGFLDHARRHELADLVWRFGPVQDFARDGARVFFTLPTRWTGTAHGTAFCEDGGWAFVLESAGGRWRILSYAWAVTAKGEP